MKKKWLIVLAVVLVIIIGWIGYSVSANSKVIDNKDISFKILSAKELDLKQIEEDTYSIEQQIGVAGGFGIQLLNIKDESSVTWDKGSDIGFIALESVNPKIVAIYPVTQGVHQVKATVATDSGDKSIKIRFSSTGAIQDETQPNTAATSTPTPEPIIDAPIESPTPAPEIKDDSITFNKSGAFYPSQPRIDNLELLVSETMDISISWPFNESSPYVYPFAYFEDSSLGDVIYTGRSVVAYSRTSQSSAITVKASKAGKTNLMVSAGNYRGQLPVEVKKNPDSGIVVLRKVETGSPESYYRSQSSVIPKGSTITLVARWAPKDGVYGESPIASDSNIVSTKVVGSGNDGLAVDVTAKQSGSTEITFEYDGTTFAYKVLVD